MKDLQIGDWLQHANGKYYQVTRIDGLSDGNIHFACGSPHLWEYNNKFKPVPITPEILESNGFLVNKHVYPYPFYEYEVKEVKVKVGFAFPQGDRTSYKEPWICIDMENVYIEHLPCVFVHQLQHALRLCGIKKEIVL